jgi:periplasmic protein TonB
VATDELEDDGRPTIGQLVSIKQPIYPVEAVRAHVEGTVRLRVVVDQIGRVEAVYVVSGPPLLVPAAIGAVREWRYNGTVLDSKAVKSVEDVAMVFRLANSVQSPRG